MAIMKISALHSPHGMDPLGL